MKKLTKAQIKRIKEKNEAFEKLKPKERMVALAKDVLSQLRLGKIEAQSGTYVEIDELSVAEDISSEDMQILILTEDPVCTVCARGAMMVSQCRIGNSVDSESVFGMDTDMKIPGIPMNIQRVIETIFEDAWYLHSNELRPALGERKVGALHDEMAEFSSEDSEFKLQCIFKNLVKNGGDYVTTNPETPGVNLTAGIWKKYESDQKYAKKRKLAAKKK